MSMPQRQVSSERKAIYYVGITLVAIGVLMFLSSFLSSMADFGNFSNFAERTRSSGTLAIGGIVLAAIGSLIQGIGKRGWAGSGVVLDPEQARRDVEPWSRSAGGVLQDTLSEVDVLNKIADRADPRQPLVKVRCRQCGALNAETSKYCDQCGTPI
jgi:RNA polymerase subunit RPABC4/transcription elongation factor Spt4